MKTVLITGGSEGIGLELAKLYAQENRVILVARSYEKLSHAAQLLGTDHVKIIPQDLSVIGSADALYEKLQEPVHILINCAGVGYAGRAEEIDNTKDEAMVTLNCTSLMSLTKLVIKEMKQRHDGIIINVGSTGAFQPGPYIAGYYASKAFVVSYTRAIAEEVKAYGIKAYCYCPGPVDTAFYEKSGGKRPSYYMSVKDAAEYLYTHQRNRVVIIPNFPDKVLYFLPSFFKMKVVKYLKRANL